MIHYREGYLYVASRSELFDTGIIPPAPICTEFFSLYADGTLEVKSGYTWDGASWCPEWLVPPDCSVVHDPFCQMTRRGILDYAIYAPQFHKLLRDMVAKRRGGFLAGIVHKAVVLAKGGYPDGKEDNPERTDP